MRNTLGRAHPCLLLIVRGFGGQYELLVLGGLLALCSRIHNSILKSLSFWFNSFLLQLIPWCWNFFLQLSCPVSHKIVLGLWDRVKHWQSEGVQSLNYNLFSYRPKIQLGIFTKPAYRSECMCMCACMGVSMPPGKKENC